MPLRKKTKTSAESEKTSNARDRIRARDPCNGNDEAEKNLPGQRGAKPDAWSCNLPPAPRAPMIDLRAPKEDFETLKRAERDLKEARDYAHDIIEAVPPLLVLDADLRVKTAIESFNKHFRVSSSQTENCLVYELGNGQWNIPKLRTFLEEVLPRHSFFKDFEVTHEFESIGRRTILLSGRQVDHLERILLFVDDITERVESRSAMRASEIRYRRLFEAARDGILILDPDSRKITDANPFMTELLGYSHEELLGRELWEIGLLKDEEASQAAFREVQEKHFIRYEDLPLQSKTGQHHEVEFVSNLYDEDGRYVIQCNIRDITERKRAEHALLDAKKEISRHAANLEGVVAERTGQLQETIGELEQFSYSVSHDMRAPLRAMQSFASYLADEYANKLDEQGVNYLQQIMRSAVRLDRLIQDVLSYTKILHANLPMAPVDLDRLVRDIAETLPNGQPIRPEIQIKGPLPKVMGNEALLAQCVSNLLSNGAKFVARGTTPHVEISAETIEGGCIRVCFKDNGVGIAAENHTRIFRLFERIHPATEYEGTGIGLTIVRKAVERMGAQVGVESDVGTGSNFWIQLKKA
jgi:PAS domain S-box-containing protein